MKKTRKTICLLVEGLDGMYYASIWPGITETVKKYGCNLICYGGGTLKKSPWNAYEYQSNVIYDHFKRENIDGLIISGSLKNYISDREFALFLERFQGLPVVTLTPTLDTIPSILIDNRSGMRSVITHLIEEHGHKRFVFIGGPKGNLDASQREEFFLSIMREYGLENGEERIIRADFSNDGGYRAALQFLQKEIQFDAVIGVNDDSALGAIDAFQEKGLRVPEDIAIVGFDGIEKGELSTPTLTSVKQPFYEIGQLSVDILLDLIDGKEVPMRTVIDAPIIIRQSCGCFINPQQAINIGSIPADIFDIESGQDYTRLRNHVVESIIAFDPSATDKIEKEEIRDLVKTFIDEIKGGKTGVFLPCLNRITRVILLKGEDALHWQNLLIVLRKFANKLTGSELTVADTILHSAYNLLSEAAVRIQAHKRLIEEQQAASMRLTGQSIANTFDIPSLTQAIEREFPKIGIDEFYLSIYKNKTYDTAELIFNLKNGKKNILPDDKVFSCNELTPEGFGFANQPWQFIVQPLYFKDEQLGFALYKPGNAKQDVFSVLSQHLCGALQGSFLMQRIKEQTLTLENTNKQLNKLREQEKAYLDAIKRELNLGRTIQASFLPDTLPVLNGWSSDFLFLPAREVSGDFYDAFTLPDGRIVFLIADVSGKDVSAALFMSLTRTLIRAFAEQSVGNCTDPLSTIQFANNYITNHHNSGEGRLMYATLFFAVVNGDTGETTYINAGHNPPALIAADGRIKRWLDRTGPAVGITQELEFGFETITINPGEQLLLYTDGVTEARNTEGDFFTRERLSDLITLPCNTASEQLNRVNEALKDFCANTDPYDDITMLALRRDN